MYFSNLFFFFFFGDTINVLNILVNWHVFVLVCCDFHLSPSLLGAIIIVLGLYFVVWGKSKDVQEALTCCEKDKPYELPVVDHCNDKSASIPESDHEPAANKLKVPGKIVVSSQEPWLRERERNAQSPSPLSLPWFSLYPYMYYVVLYLYMYFYILLLIKPNQYY